MNGRIAVRLLDPERTSRGGIIIPDGAQKKSQLGRVFATCAPWLDANGEHRHCFVRVDDLVLVPKYAGEEFDLDGDQKIVMIKHDELLGRINREEIDAEMEVRDAPDLAESAA